MRTAASAMAWELRRRHRWGILAVIAAIAAQVAIKPALLTREGELAVDDAMFAFLVLVPLSAAFFYFLAVFTFGMSLKGWRNSGMLELEWALYRALLPHYSRLTLLTYGGEEDAAILAELLEEEEDRDKVKLVCNLEGADPLGGMGDKFGVAPRSPLGLRLALDLRLQRVAVKALGSDFGAVVMLDPVTGEILVLASTPTYDASAVANPATAATTFEALVADKTNPLLPSSPFTTS